MIERYTLPEMGRIWSEQNKLEKWLQFEILACEALAELGEIPSDAVERIRSKARFDAKRGQVGRRGRVGAEHEISCDSLDARMAVQPRIRLDGPFAVQREVRARLDRPACQ